MGSRKNIPIVKALLAAMFARQLTFFFSFGLGGLFNGRNYWPRAEKARIAFFRQPGSELETVDLDVAPRLVPEKLKSFAWLFPVRV